MENVMTPIGTITIFDSRYIYEVAERFVSEEYANVVKSMVDVAKEEADDYRLAWEMDKQEVADAVDETETYWKDVLRDIQEVLVGISNNVNTMTKYELQNSLNTIIQSIENDIYK